MMNQEILIDGVPVQIPAGNYKTEYLPDGTVQIVVYSNNQVDTGAEGEFKWKGKYCRTVGVQNTTVPHLNSYDFLDRGIQTEAVSESEDEAPNDEVQVEDENIEELIRDEEVQEKVGRGKGKRKRGRPPTTFKPIKRKSYSNASVIQNIQEDEIDPTDKTVHKCGLCGITYKRRANWMNHLKTHAQEKVYMCGYCGNLFQKANFLNHLKTHQDEQDEEKLRPTMETNPRKPDKPNLTISPIQTQPSPDIPEPVSLPPSHPPLQTIHETETEDGEKQFMVKSHQVTLPNQQVATLIDLGNLMDVSGNGDESAIEDPQLKIATSAITETGALNNDDPDYLPDGEVEDTKFIYKCNVCGKEYNSKSNCHRHLKTHTHAKVFKCNDCDKTYMHRYELKMHRRIHTGEKPFKCPICTRAFNESGNLRRHMKIHAGDDTPYKCGVCFKGFSDMYRLHVHLKVHSGEIVCDTCGKTFGKISDLYRHIRIHTGDKPYKCDICKKAFAQKVNLQTHYRTHTGKTPFRCELCNFGFSRKQILDNHMRGHEQEELEELKKKEAEKEGAAVEQEVQMHIQNVMDAAAVDQEGLMEVPEDAQEVETGLSQEDFDQLVAASVVETEEIAQ